MLMKNGKLYIVSTPVGNLGDITFRAIETLKKCDLIMAEDTRQTLKLLNNFNIRTKLISYHKFNEKSRSHDIIAMLKDGKTIALVSDAGTPMLSDPGYIITKACIQESIDIEAIPGPSSVLPALLLSGFDPGKFFFYGFLPKKLGKRKEKLESFKSIQCPVIIFESPNRVKATLKDIIDTLGDIDAAVAKELTKIHEKVFRGKISELLATIDAPVLMGEFTIVILPGQGGERKAEKIQLDIFDVKERVDFYLQQGMTMKEAIKSTAEETSMKKSDVYKIAHNLKMEH